jgi:hypothetical protein
MEEAKVKCLSKMLGKLHFLLLLLSSIEKGLTAKQKQKQK